MDCPLVSIVLAAYQPKYSHFQYALESALGQSYSNIEVDVCDDSPTDSLSECVALFCDDRIRYRHNKPPLGVALNHWQAFTKARGEFVVILNHDDVLDPQFVSTLIVELQLNPDAVLAFSDHWIIDSDGNINVDESNHASLSYGRAHLRPGFHKPFYNLLMSQSIPMAMGTVFRFCALPKELPRQAGPAYDLWLTYLLARSGGGACYIPKRLSSWRSHSANLTSCGGVSWWMDEARCWQAVAADNAFIAHSKVARAKAAGAYTACALRSMRERQRSCCMRYMVLALKIRFSWRTFAMLLLLPCMPIFVLNALKLKFRKSAVV